MLPTPTSSPFTPRSVCPFSLDHNHPQEETATSIPTSPVLTHKLTLPTVQEETAPTGWTVRGQYAVSSSFVDDDKKTHLQFEWAFEIDKDW